MRALNHYTIVLDSAGDYRREHYGVLYQSRNVYRTAYGHSPTRLAVWDNTQRPNPDRGKRIGDTLRHGGVVTKYSKRGTTKALYLSPNGNPTDCERTILLSPEASSIDAYGTGTGTAASGQVYAKNAPTMRDGDTATLIYPDGTEQTVTLMFQSMNNGHGYAEEEGN